VEEALTCGPHTSAGEREREGSGALTLGRGGRSGPRDDGPEILGPELEERKKREGGRMGWAGGVGLG
jgi:hypothetical protein